MDGVFHTCCAFRIWILANKTFIHTHTHIHTYTHTYMFVVVNFDALAQASDIRIERRQVVFLCWMQDSNPRSQTPIRQQTECLLTNRLSYRGSTHACMHACMHTCMHTCIHTYIRTYIHTYIHFFWFWVSTSVTWQHWRHIRNIIMLSCIHPCICISIYTYNHTSIHPCIHSTTFIHTQIHIWSYLFRWHND